MAEGYTPPEGQNPWKAGSQSDDRPLRSDVSIEDHTQHFMSRVSSLMKDKANLRTPRWEVRSEARSSGSAKSSFSRFSKSSAASSRKADAVAKAAAMKAKLKYMDKENQMKAELERLQTMRELDIAEEQIKALDQLEREDSIGSLSGGPPGGCDLQLSDGNESECGQAYVKQYVESLPVMTNREVEASQTPAETYHENPRPSTSPVLPAPAFDTSQNSQNYDLVPSQLQTIINLGRLPTPEPDIFTGDPIHYLTWKRAFEALIENRGIIQLSDRLYYLKKYLDGEAREEVQVYFLSDSRDAYREAKELLEERYGDPFIVASAFREKLDSWLKIQSKDSQGLRKFADFLRQCQIVMKGNQNLQILNDIQENKKLMAKLPEWMVRRWGRIIVAAYKRESSTYPPLSEFVAFVKEARIACEPALRDLNTTSRDRKSPQAKPSRSMATEVKTTTCIFCEKDHRLDKCETFLKKPLQERKDFVKAKGLCFGCLARGHLSKDCKRRLACNVCSRRHPTALHGDTKPTPGADVKKAVTPHVSHLSDISLQVSSQPTSKASMIVPVWVSHRNNPDREVLAYALLDSQSDTTFILDRVCNKLGIVGQEVRLSLSTMTAEDQVINSKRVDGLIVRAHNCPSGISLPATYTRDIMPANREHIPTSDMAKSWNHLRRIADKIPALMDCDVGLLIGYNCPSALTHREVIPPESEDQPFGQRTDLGWGIVGIVSQPTEAEASRDVFGVSHRVVMQVPPALASGKDHAQVVVRNKVKEIDPLQINQWMEMDFNEQKATGRTLSQEDRRFLQTMEDGIRLTERHHYEMPLPFKSPPTSLPDNKPQVMKRLEHLKKKFKRNYKFAQDYNTFMQSLIEHSFAERVQELANTTNDQSVWYIPHHGVYHPKKPDKIRVVFDCSARYQGHALNDYLLQGPDLTNGLVRVICRFRQESIAFMCDVEQMFYQFEVTSEHRRYLRFLWWENGDYETEPVEYQMNVHLFGAVSSPGCANFGLKRIADENEAKYGFKAADFVLEDFYVDDGLKSVPTVEEAIDLITNTKEMCSRGGLRLHKFVSNSEEVMSAVPPEDRAKGVKDLNHKHDDLPIERALGIQWCIESDTFVFRITLRDQPLTRRGVLSTVSSVYDPLGFLAPLLLKERQILQCMCKEGSDWDSPLPDHLRACWELWRNSLLSLQSLKISRCYKPKDFGSIKAAELHHFSDASTEGYGMCSYLRLVDDQQRVHCTFLMGKSRVTPLKVVTIPRFELTAAVVSVRVSALLKKELKLNQEVSETFWTDSKIVLAYIANESRRFHVFVANRVQVIRSMTDPSEWKYIKTDLNPADEASRGINPTELMTSSKWLTGPDFLWMKEIPVHDSEGSEPTLSNHDPDVKRTTPLATHVDENPRCTLLEHLEYFSSWSHATRAVANCLKIKRLLKNRALAKRQSVDDQVLQFRPATVQDICEAEKEIIRMVQRDTFEEELKILTSLQVNEGMTDRENARKRNHTVKSTSSLYRLDPFVDGDGVMRVGGRIKRADLSSDIKNPVILPRRHHITVLIVRHFHKLAGHQGRGITTSLLRSNGYWVIGCSAAVSSVITRCVKCRRIRSKPQEQKMADLPEDRLSAAPPFTFCTVDFFGPWLIKEGRKEMKRWGVLFTCMASRAVHIETAVSLSADSFINALRRFISTRGPIQQLRSDRGTNSVGAETELKQALNEMNQDRVCQFLLGERCDYFNFRMNVPSASHMGGAWERQIRTVRSVLTALLSSEGTQLDDESLRTLLCEVTAIVNSRPLTVDNLNDPTSLAPLTPNHILTMKSKVILPPPGEFQREDMYLRKRWRRVQHLANEFWGRWQKEYLQNLQSRTKWVQPRRDLQIGDIVIVREENLPRNKWTFARVEDTHVDQDGHVRKVKVVKGDKTLDKKGRRVNKKGRRVNSQTHLERPIHKLVLLLERPDQTRNQEN